MVATMAYRDTEVAAVPDVAEGALVRTPRDWRRLYEQTLERAEAAEARAEELKWAEVVARSAAESLKWQFKEARRKRLAAVEDANEARRATKNALFLEAEVARLTRLLGEAGVDPQPRGTEISLRREVARLRKVVARAKVQADAELRKALRRSRRQKTALNALTKENARLRRTAKASQGRVGTLPGLESGGQLCELDERESGRLFWLAHQSFPVFTWLMFNTAKPEFLPKWTTPFLEREDKTIGYGPCAAG